MAAGKSNYGGRQVITRNARRSYYRLLTTGYCLLCLSPAGGAAALLAAEVRREQLLGAVAAALVLLLGLAEELRQLLVLLLLGVGDVERRRLRALERVVDDTHEVVRDVPRPGVALAVITSLCRHTSPLKIRNYRPGDFGGTYLRRL